MLHLNILGLAFAAFAGQAAADCSRDTLLAAADAYIAAQISGAVAGSAFQKLLDPAVKYRQNNKAADVTTGLLSKPLKLDHNRTTLDTTQCASYTELVSTAGPYVIGTQLHHASATDASSPIVLVDTIVATTGDWAFNAAKTLGYIQPEDWGTLAEGDRSPRALLQAAGDAYLDMWSNATAAQAVPWGTPCTRLEGSAYTGHNRPDDSCKAGIPSNHNQAPNTHRRYVIDEAMGSVSVFCVWEHMMNAADSHELRLEGGKLRYVHTMTSCGSKACKL